MSNLAAFLRVIRAGESSQDDSAYRMMFGGGMFDGFADHPRQVNHAAGLSSTAAGAYQFLSRTWDECKAALGLPDFSPTSQDAAAAFLIKRRGALADVEAGRIESAIRKCAKEWASLPGSPYGQPTMTMDRALKVYQQYGGQIDTSAEPVQNPAESKPMAPFLIPAVIELAKLIPKLGGLFGGSEVAQRNVKAAEVVVDAVTSAVGASNAQEAVEKIQADPAMKAAAEKAVEGVWYQITEAGGGGIDGARKADAASVAGGEPWKSPVLWVTIMLVPLVYIALYAVLFREGFSNDIKAMVLGAIFGGLLTGGIQAYFYGTSASSQRKTELMGK